jgi:hypothetical protein
LLALPAILGGRVTRKLPEAAPGLPLQLPQIARRGEWEVVVSVDECRLSQQQRDPEELCGHDADDHGVVRRPARRSGTTAMICPNRCECMANSALKTKGNALRAELCFAVETLDGCGRVGGQRSCGDMCVPKRSLGRRGMLRLHLQDEDLEAFKRVVLEPTMGRA